MTKPSVSPAASQPNPAALLAWYDRHRRDLPWRAAPGAHPDPYVVWLSEIMLQQTTVEVVKRRFPLFLAQFPNVRRLAAASLDQVMRAWAGLGYYSRARNLHACAQRIAAEHAGRFPDREAELRALPGVGAYTAAAIAAIAFDRRAVVVDGNVERVIARVFGIAEPLPGSRPAVRRAADSLTPAMRPGDFAQAMMDLGSLVCTPRQPSCGFCPFAPACAARSQGCAESLPARAAKAARPERRGAVFLIRRADGCVLVRTRPPTGLLGGMTEFPGTFWEARSAREAAAAEAPIEARYRRLPGEVTHTFTHFSLKLAVFAASVPPRTPAPQGCRFVSPDELESEALPSVMRKVMAHALKCPPEAERSESQAAPDLFGGFS